MDCTVHSLNYSDIKNQLSGLPIGQRNNNEGVETAEDEESASNLAELTSVLDSLHPRAKEVFWAIKPEGSTAQSLKKPVTKVDYTSVHKYLKYLLELKLVRRDVSETQHVYFRAVEFPIASPTLKNVPGASVEVVQEHFSESEQNGCTSNISANHFTANHKIENETMDTSTSTQQVSSENTVSQVAEDLVAKMKEWTNLRHQTMQIEQEVEKLGGKSALELLKIWETGINKA